jgi:hypothetical protein
VGFSAFKAEATSLLGHIRRLALTFGEAAPAPDPDELDHEASRRSRAIDLTSDGYLVRFQIAHAVPPIWAPETHIFISSRAMERVRL